MKIKLILTAILILGAILRFINLSSSPPSLSWDEVSHGYNAYSILKTGTDEWGQSFPIFNFRAYGDYPLPMYMYLSMPFIAVFGLNEFSIRFMSAFLGSLLILITYFLTKEFLKSTNLALVSAFLLAISPWDLLLSRQVLQGNPAIFLVSLGICLIIIGFKKNHYLIIAGITSLSLSAYAYHNTRILAPLIIAVLILTYLKRFLVIKRIFILTIIISAIFILPLAPVVLSSEGSARATWVGILDQGAINRINEQRNSSRLPDPMPVLFHNKVTYLISTSLKNYVGYFSPQFLGFFGGSHYQFSIPGFGVMYPIELVFFYFGLIGLIFKFRKNSLEQKFLLFWLLLAPIPAAITRDSYQVVRAMTMLPIVYIVTCLGISNIIDLSKKYKLNTVILFGGFFLILSIFAGRYLYNLFLVYPTEYSYAWQYGYKEIVEYVKNNESKYDQIFITKKYGEAHEFLLFYKSYDPQKYQTDKNLIRYGKSNWFWVDRFDKYNFVNDWEIKEKVNCPDTNRCLLITSPSNYPNTANKIDQINFLDSKPAFDIVEL